MNEPRRHRSSLHADTRLRASMLKHRVHNLFGRRNALTTPKSMAFAINDAESRGLL